MSTKKLIIASLAGGLAMFLLGWAAWGYLLADFFASQSPSLASVMKDPPTIWAVGLGNLSAGALLALIFGRWAGIKTFATGAVSGALIGALVGLSVDLTLFGSTTLMSLNGILVDVVANVVVTGLAGGLVGWLLGRD
jgi:hypothetical protein